MGQFLEILMPFSSYLAVIAVTGISLAFITKNLRSRQNQKLAGTSEARYKTLVEKTRVIAWEADAATWQITYVSPQAEDILGYPLSAWYTQDFWVRHLHAEDRDRAVQFCHKSSLTKTHYEFEYRMIKPDDTVIWLRDFVTVYLNPAGKRTLGGYMIDVTAQVEGKLEVEKKAHAATEASRAKSSFLANMSHEIRTPLSSILGFSEILKTESMSTAESQRFLDAIVRNGQTLMQIIGDILDVSKIEAGHLDVVKTTFDLKDYIVDLHEMLKTQAEVKGISLSFSFAKELPDTVTTDAALLKQIIINIVDNAIKFTDSGKVLVSLSTEISGSGKLLAITVTDSGAGINEDRQELLFQPFSQVTHLFGTKPAGSGLGLMLSRQLANALGGDVKLVSSEVHRGSTFQITVAMDSETESGSGIKKSLSVQPQVLRGVRILACDDSSENLALVQTILKKAGASVDTVTTGQECVALALTGGFSLILLDVQMPLMSGIEVVRQLRGKKYSGLIIALTAQILKEDKERCLAAGFDAYMTKPISSKRLVDEILQALPQMTH